MNLNQSIDVVLKDTTGKEFEFKQLNSFYSFCKEEFDFWNEIHESLPEDTRTIYSGKEITNQFHKIIGFIDSLINGDQDWDEEEFNYYFQTFNRGINQNYSMTLVYQSDSGWLWRGHPFISTWIELYKKSAKTAGAFIRTLVERNSDTINESVDHMIGHILGYEYLMQNESEIIQRRNSEIKSLSQLRDELTRKTDEFISESDKIKDDIGKWSKNERNKTERLYMIRKKLAERQIRKQSKRFIKELSGWNKKVKNLESTYEEHLKLRKPAEYWKKAADRYKKQGWIFTTAIVLLAFGGLYYFGTFFVAWLQDRTLYINLSTLQGAVILGISVAIYAFIVRVFSRLAFSSFHLMRDAEEREQLTYLYLSLSEETSVDENARNIILQALFSRTETGLLAQEHGPTMPGIGDVMKAAPKPKT